MTSVPMYLASLVDFKGCVSTSPLATMKTRRMFDAIGWKVPIFKTVEDAFRLAVAMGASHAFVCDDTLVYTYPDADVAEELDRALDSPPDLLSVAACSKPAYCSKYVKKDGFEYIFETSCMCIHAGIYSKEYMQRYLETKGRARPKKIETMDPAPFVSTISAAVPTKSIIYDPLGLPVLVNSSSTSSALELLLPFVALLGVISMIMTKKNL